jgi:hypothetical protein
MRLLLATALLIVPAAAQTTIAAKSGAVAYVEGAVSLDGKPLDPAAPRFTAMAVDSVLRSENGRAEVMLNPCAVLHAGENTAIRMVDNALPGPRVELLAGSVVVETDGGARYAGVRLMFRQRTVRLGANGIYRLETDPPRLKVFEGAAVVDGADKVRAGHSQPLDAGSAAKFDRRRTDALGRWHARRIWTLEEQSGLAAASARKWTERPPQRIPVGWPESNFSPSARHRVCGP